MTRKTMSQESDISERHLAQIESGEGNVSIALLRRIAISLGATLRELFETAAPEAPEQQALRTLIGRLPVGVLPEVVSRIQREFLPHESARRERFALIGLRGAGKSTLGARLAAALEIPFVEVDSEIERETGMRLTDIFSLYGQNGYRSIEYRVLQRALREHSRAVLSVGGGIVAERESYDLLLSSCYTIWIQAQPEEHMARVIAQGDFRAMAGNKGAMADLRRILEAREPLYRRADAFLNTSGDSVEDSLRSLQSMVEAARL